MPDINLHDLSHDELTHLINEATNLRTTKFESQPTKPEKPYLRSLWSKRSSTAKWRKTLWPFRRQHFASSFERVEHER